MFASIAIAITLFACGLAAGVLYWRWRLQAAEHAARRIPKEWPLKARPLVNSKERRVWLWLAKVMFDQQIMIKIPVTRFTTPSRAEEAEHWFKLLNGLYCTFTVCDLQGRVLGCVDVPGKQGLSIGNQSLKHSLLSQCDLPYWVVEPDNLPHLAQIRTAFLGAEAVHGSDAHLHDRLRDVAVTLQAAVSKQRSHKTTPVHGMPPPHTAANGTVPPHWEDNSFLAPLDSRAGELRK